MTGRAPNPPAWDTATFAKRLGPVWAYLALEHPPEPADVIFVFGSQDLAIPRRAAELYRHGFAPLVLVSGHYGRMTRDVFDKPEALVFKDCLIEQGVPPSAVVTETAAANTVDNVRCGLDALRRHGTEIRSALLVAKRFAMRRCLATFARQASHVRVRACAPTGGLVESVDRDPAAFAARVVAEIDRLEAICRER